MASDSASPRLTQLRGGEIQPRRRRMPLETINVAVDVDVDRVVAIKWRPCSIGRNDRRVAFAHDHEP